MNSDQFAGLFDNNPGCGIGYRKNTRIDSDLFVADIFLKPVRDLLREEGDTVNKILTSTNETG